MAILLAGDNLDLYLSPFPSGLLSIDLGLTPIWVYLKSLSPLFQSLILISILLLIRISEKSPLLETLNSRSLQQSSLFYVFFQSQELLLPSSLRSLSLFVSSSDTSSSATISTDFESVSLRLHESLFSYFVCYLFNHNVPTNICVLIVPASDLCSYVCLGFQLHDSVGEQCGLKNRSRSLARIFVLVFGDNTVQIWEQRSLSSSWTCKIWDALRCKRIRTMEGHRLRVGALAWSSSVLSSGSRDKSILQRDIRSQEDHVSKLTGHRSEVCGLKWSYDNRELASGGNDNRVCNLAWSKNVNELVSTHGYSQNQIIVWKYHE